MAGKGRKKGESYMKVLGLFDKKTRLVLDARAFVIQIFHIPEKGENVNDGTWKSTFYYSTLPDSIRGYCKYISKDRKPKKVISKPVLDLLDLVSELEKTITKSCAMLSSEFKKLNIEDL